MKFNQIQALCLSFLASATLLAGCAGGAAKARSAASQQEPVVIVGQLTDNGVGCTALRAADGQIYTFARDLEGTKKGETLQIEGYVVQTKGCMVGINVMPRRAVELTGEARAALGSPLGSR